MLQVTAFDPAVTDRLMRLWRDSFERALGFTDPHPIEDQRAFFLAEVLPRHQVQLAWRDDALAGFIAHGPDTVSQLFVHVDHQGQGVGSHLLGLAQQASSGRLKLFTFARNLGAQRFYLQHGFVEVARGFEPFWQLEDIAYEWRRPLSGDPMRLTA